jgi:AcrR family transcriptional regulator
VIDERGTGGLENRRERRKRLTRTAIVQAARELFLEKGFEQTTLTEIAERADVASSTLFTHFSTKAEIFFADYRLFVQDHIRILETRDREHESAIEATIRWHEEVWEHKIDVDHEWFRHMRRIVDSNPVLTALEYQQYEASAEVLTREIAYDIGASEHALPPRLIASVKIGLYFALARFRSANDIPVASAPDQMQYVDQCLRVAAAAIASVPVPSSVRSYDNGLPAPQGPLREARGV